MKKVLSIAASDPSGGAGIEADLKVFAQLGGFGLTAITGLTVQGPKGIEKIIPTPKEEFRRILEIHLTETKPDAVKIGALIDAEHIEAVKAFLFQVKIPAVLDPILLSSTGYELLEKPAWSRLESLFSLVSIITPNLREAEILSGVKITSEPERISALEILAQKGSRAILLKGGHLQGEPEDWFWQEGKLKKFQHQRIPGEIHGTGCVLSSAIAGYLAGGLDLVSAVSQAEGYLEQALNRLLEFSGVKYLSQIFD